jgi:peptide/nickel transport system ATP-binding protein
MYAGDTCETAAVKTLFENPLHPYTQGLLKSVPKMKQTEGLATIPGIVPNLVEPPSGCRFHPRCPHMMEICRTEKPPQFTSQGDPEHTVSCHLYSKEAEQS